MKKKRSSVIILFFVAVIVLFFSVGCKTKTVYVPIESVRTEYINKLHRDSILFYDSIFVKEKGDTIWLEKYRYVFRDKLRVDTIRKCDTIQVCQQITEYKEVNRLTTFQSFQVWCGRILLGLLLLYFGCIWLKKYLKF